MADIGSAEQNSAPSNPQGMPTGAQMPTLVVDVGADHVWGGGVPKQLYLMLWIACMFLLGSILAWRGGAQSMNLLQSLLCIFSIAAVWSCITGVRGRRPHLGALFIVEFVAIFGIVLFYNSVSATAKHDGDVHLNAINAERDVIIKALGGKANLDAKYIELGEMFDRVSSAQDWGVGDLFMAPVSMVSKPVTDPERLKQVAAWDLFGTGFYLTALASIFFLVFFIMSIVVAVKSANKKEAAAPPPARTPRRPAKDADDGAKATAKSGEAPKA